MAKQVTSDTAQQPSDVPDVVARMVKRVVRVAQPLQVILFGSQARGDTHRWSDIDLLVVIPNMADKQRVGDTIRAALRRSDVTTLSFQPPTRCDATATSSAWS